MRFRRHKKVDSPPGRPSRARHFTQEGVALIAVASTLAILGVMVYEFGTETTTDAIAASNNTAEMQAEFLTRSGANLSQLIIRLQTDLVDKYRKQLGDFQLSDYASMFMGAFGGGKDEVNALAMALGGFTGDAIKGLGVPVGSFDVNITTDDGRINMNCANGTDKTQQVLEAQLEALFYFRAFDPIFENPDAEGWRRDRKTQAAALIDYIDRGSARFGAPGTTESDYGYQDLPDRYKPKDNYLDTIGELKQVRGVDDRFWSLFGDQLTIYGDCKVNIGSVNDPKLIGAILFLSAKNQDDPVLKDPNMLWALSKLVVDAKGWGVTFDDLSAFSDFVKDPVSALGGMFATQGASGGASATSLPPGLLGNASQIKGLELDSKKLAEVARSGARRIYRIHVVATVPRGVEGSGFDYVRRLTAVWDTQTQNQNARDPAYSRGTWVYWREE